MLKNEIEFDKKPQIISVLLNDLCIACGACINICNNSNIEEYFCKFQNAFQVKVNNLELCLDCLKPCDIVCPSIELNFCYLLKKESVKDYGDIIDIKLAKSYKFSNKENTSSGGIASKIIEIALSNNTPVISLTEKNNQFYFSVLNNLNDLDCLSSSIYHSISFNNCIELISSIEKPCILVALPCQLEGLYKYAKYCNIEIEKKILLTVGIICGWSYSHHSYKSFCKFNKINNIINVKYRGEDQKGFLKLITQNSIYKFKRWNFESLSDLINYRASFSRYSNRFRCRVCHNHLNILSDISIGDAWVKRNNEKKSIVIIRTLRGEKYFDKIAADEDIVIEVAFFEDIINSQSKSITYNIEASALLQKLNSYNLVHFNYNFGHEKTNYQKVSTLRFFLEKYMRRIIRENKYAKYKYLYIILNIKAIIFNFLKMKIR